MKRGWMLFIGLSLSLGLAASRIGVASVGIEDRQGNAIEAQDLHFTDEDGSPVTLDRYFHLKRPVILVPMYFGCPGPCTVLLDDLVSTLKSVNASAGRGYEVVLLSIDPDEKAALAKAKKQYYLKLYGRPETARGWHFLTGAESESRKAAARLGFEFERDARTGRITHPSAVYILTTDGVLSKTFTSLRFSRRALFVSLYEAGRGRTQLLFDRVSEICSAYGSPLRWFHSAPRWIAAAGGVLAGAATLGVFLI